MSQALELYSKIQNPVEGAMQIGAFFAKSGMFGCDRAEQGMVLAMECMLTGQSPSQITRTYHIIDGKLSKKALAIAAEFRAKGGKIEWIHTGRDGVKAEAKFTFEGQSITESFTIDEAKKQGLVREKSNWIKTPANMLRARVLSNAIGMLAPEIVAGSESTDDDETIQPEKELLTKQAQVSEVKTVETPKVEPVQTAPAPVIEAAPLEVVSKAEVDPETNLLTAATVLTLHQVIGDENAAKALEFLKAKGQIKGDKLDELPVGWAQRIIDSPAKFLSAIGGGK